MIEWDNFFWFTSYILVFTALSAFGAHRIKVLYHFWKHRHEVPVPHHEFAELPRITVQLPIFNELHVVENLLRTVSALDYPRDRLQIQVLDDSTDETAAHAGQLSANLKAQGYDIEYRHRSNRHGFKAGALDEGMASATGEYICIFDADFQPAPDYLKQVIHHFTNEKVGMVQARWGHLNKDFSLLTRLQALFLDGHLVLEQTARSRHGEFLNFNGTAGIWRKQTIIDAGGWQHDTLTEDLDLSYRAQMKGWKFIFLKDVICPAELPVDMNGFKSQQHRWTKGSIQTCRKMLGPIWRSHMPLMLKIEATVHLTANYAYLLLFLLIFLVFPGAGSDFKMGGYRLWLFDLPVFILTTVSIGLFYLSSQIAAYPKTGWKNIIYLPVLLALGIGMSINNGKAVLEAMLGQESAFIRTPKYGIEKKGQQWKKAKYKSLKSLVVVLEIILAVYFTGTVIFAILNNYWNSVPFLIMFMLGFWYVVAGSFPQLFQNRQPEPPVDPAAA